MATSRERTKDLLYFFFKGRCYNDLLGGPSLQHTEPMWTLKTAQIQRISPSGLSGFQICGSGTKQPSGGLGFFLRPSYYVAPNDLELTV